MGGSIKTLIGWAKERYLGWGRCIPPDRGEKNLKEGPAESTGRIGGASTETGGNGGKNPRGKMGERTAKSARTRGVERAG